MDHIIFTAGAPSGRYASERAVKATDYQGVVDTIAAARQAGFQGRFVYLNSIGIGTSSLAGTLINLLKRNTLVWRRRVEDDIRASGLDLHDHPRGLPAQSACRGACGRRRAGRLPLAPNRIARADVAEAFVEAMEHPHASRTTFEIAWGKGARRENWNSLSIGSNRTRDDGNCGDSAGLPLE